MAKKELNGMHRYQKNENSQRQNDEDIKPSGCYALFTHINIAGIDIVGPCLSIYVREFNTVIIICSKKRNIK